MARVVVAKVATPPEPTVPVPIAVDPSLKVTVPVGVPEEAVTVAVKVTDCVGAEGLSDDVRVVELVNCATTWLTVFDVEPLKEPAPA